MPSHERTVDILALSDLSTPWSLHVVVTLQIAEQIAAGHTRIDELAGAARCNAGALERVLRHLAANGIFEQPEPGRFTLNEPARALMDPSTRLGLDLDGIGGRMAHSWSTLLAAVRTGAPAYHTVFGRPFWDDLEAHPAIAESFDALMGPAGHGRPDPAVLLDGDWAAVRSVVDVGGGTGAHLAAILQARPDVRGTLVDRPSTVARSGSVFTAAGVADRVTIAGQSFFDPLPPGADLYLLKNVLADWPDAEAIALLRRCADAARPTGRVIVLGGVTPGSQASPELLMLVLVGGKSRSLDEFHALASAAGLEVQATGRQSSGRFIVECRSKNF